MKHVLLPDNKVRPLPFYLAMEEFLATRSTDDYFFMWQVKPTVIIGRNQHILTEVNIDYCRSRGINLYRRKSGGGCVYADMNNVMLSYITTSTTVTDTFADYTDRVAEMLRKMGIDALAGGRNDVLIGGRKVSGNAFYHKQGRAILHGTMLYDTDVVEMLHAITPSSAKLSSKGVESVRSRVTNLAEHTTVSLDTFKKQAAEFMCDSEITLTAADIRSIERIAEPYYTDDWLFGHSPRADINSSHRIEGVGEINVSVALDGCDIADIHLSGDFFPLSDPESLLLGRLKGVRYSREAISDALNGVDATDIIAGLTTEQLINTLI